MSLRKNNMKKQNLLWVFLSLLVTANVYLGINYATSGVEISHLEDQEKSMNDEKSSLSEQLLRSASLKQVEYKAVEMGFGKPTSILYLNGEESVAKLP